MFTRIGSLVLLGLVLFFFVVLAPGLIHFYFDWLWFDEVGFAQVFQRMFTARFSLWVAVFLIAYLWLYLHWLFAAKRLPPASRPLFLDPQGTQVIDIGQNSIRLIKPLAVVIAFLTAQAVSHFYMDILTFLQHASFGRKDPIWGYDLSFYFFELPVWKGITLFGLFFTGLAWVGILLLSWTRNLLSLGQGGWRFPSQIRGQSTLLGILFFLLLAAQTYWNLPELLYSTRGPVQGASYVDIHVVAPALRIAVAAGILAALVLAVNYFRHFRRALAIAIGLYFGTLFLGVQFLPMIVQKLVVAPNELERETPYILHNIAATRHSFGVEKVIERDISGDKQLNAQDIERNAKTLRNIRLWEHRQLLDTFAQIQEIRTYYNFISVDNDRYMLQGESRQLMLSPRELNSANLPERNWLNEHLTFTHGYGLAMGPVNHVTSEGLPLLTVQDIPPTSSTKDLQVKRPEIYYGELTEPYAFVNTNNPEFNYPSGDKNVYTRYQGSGGVQVGSLWRKALMAAQFQSLNILTSPLITNDSRILYYRSIHKRVRMVAPFLQFDQDPYLTLTPAGRLVWIYDAYTVSSHYPYAQRTPNGINYIRNSVKVTVDAYDGTMILYLADPEDPVALTYARIFPGIFRPLSSMEEGLRRHLRYPEDLFSLQTRIFSVYHMDQAQIFYNREDQWEIPAHGGTQERMKPYYTIMKLPGEKSEEFLLMLPFTPRGRDNLAAWMAARNDGEAYGQLAVYRFPKQKLVYGPKQIENRIQQDTFISREVTLWDQRGSEVIYGTLLVIPVEESLIYVRPLYTRAEGGKIPELKRIIVAYENNIAMAETLELALARIFPGFGPSAAGILPEIPESGKVVLPASGTIPSSVSGSDSALQALRHYQAAVEAQRQGNWSLYGEELKKLEAALLQMQKR